MKNLRFVQLLLLCAVLSGCGGDTSDRSLIAQAKAATAWTDCAQENQTCTVTGTRVVQYGAGSSWVSQTVTGSVLCANSVFGDPIYGTLKSCQYGPDTSGAPPPPPPIITSWTPCAQEGQTCSFSGTRTVQYGAGTKQASGTFSGSVLCDNSVFGDPVYGVAKSCQYSAVVLVNPDWLDCATENQSCAFSGTRVVRYGAGSTFASQTFTSSVLCSNSVFGDPLPGTAKTCQYSVTSTTPVVTPPVVTPPVVTPPVVTPPVVIPPVVTPPVVTPPVVTPPVVTPPVVTPPTSGGPASWTTGATPAAGSAPQITILPSTVASQTAPPSTVVSIGINVNVASAVPDSYSMSLFLVNSQGVNVVTAPDLLNGGLILSSTVRWMGPMYLSNPMTIPALVDGTYYVMLGLYNATGPIALTAGPGVVVDNQSRYNIGTITVKAGAPVPSQMVPATIDVSAFHLTFEDTFTTLSLSDGSANNGSKWYTHNEQCCMDATGPMNGLTDNPNPFSLVPGGLNIRLQKTNGQFSSGVLTSVDGTGVGFSQKYGYFEMKAKFPNGIDTWPAFWLRNLGFKSQNVNRGEIDIVEHTENPTKYQNVPLASMFGTALHDWTNGTAPFAGSKFVSPITTDGNYHTYGMKWTATSMTFYYDGAMTFQVPTPAVMQAEPYYILIDLGVGAGGWPTDQTPAINDMVVAYIRAYSF